MALTALVVLAAAALVWVLRDAGDDSGADVSSADAADAVVVSSGVKDAVRERAATSAAAAYSYSWKTLADDKAAARELMTPSDARALRPHDGRRRHVEPPRPQGGRGRGRGHRAGDRILDVRPGAGVRQPAHVRQRTSTVRRSTWTACW